MGKNTGNGTGENSGTPQSRIRNRRRVSNHALYIAQTWGFTDWKI